MTSRQMVARNAVWNGVGTAAEMLSGFLVAPYLVRSLGATTYGLWILIASMTGYFALLDLGVRGSVGRQIAFHRARGDREGVNHALGAALAILAGAALFALVLTGLAREVFPLIFEVPPDRVAEVRLATLIVGVNLAASLLGNAFDATLWGMQRFDLLNAVDIPVTLARVGLTFWLVGTGGSDLFRLAAITLGVTLLGGASKAVLSFRVDRGLAVGWAGVNSASIRPLLGYGSSYFLLSFAQMAAAQFTPILIGLRLGVALVTPFSIAMRLISYARSVVVAGTGVITPVATALHAGGEEHKQRDLLTIGGRYCSAAALFFLGFFALLGEGFIETWMKTRMPTAGACLRILAAGEVVAMSQWISHSVILGRGGHRRLAALWLAEAVCVLAIGSVVVKPYGLVGLSVTIAGSSLAFRGLGQMIYACRLTQVRVGHYLASSVAPALVASIGPIAVLAGIVATCRVATWWHMISCLAVYGIGWGLAMAPMILADRRQRDEMLSAGRSPDQPAAAAVAGASRS